MSKLPVISIISSAIKVEYWKRFHKSCGGGNVPWEIVFVGSRSPSFSLPENFRHIHSIRKPMQCLEIAARKARGEYLLVAPDDVVFHHESLDYAYVWRQHLPPFSIVGMRYRIWDKNIEQNLQSLLQPQDMASPVLPICGLVKRSEWYELGGIDRRFVGSHGDSDLYLRCKERGGWFFISTDSIVIEHDTKDERSRLCVRFRHDYQTLVSLWVIEHGDGHLEYPKHRLDSVTPYDRATLETVDQGSVAGWA